MLIIIFQNLYSSNMKHILAFVKFHIYGQLYSKLHPLLRNKHHILLLMLWFFLYNKYCWKQPSYTFWLGNIIDSYRQSLYNIYHQQNHLLDNIFQKYLPIFHHLDNNFVK